MKTVKIAHLDRRDFVRKSALGLGGLILASAILPSRMKWMGANDRISIVPTG